MVDLGNCAATELKVQRVEKLEHLKKIVVKDSIEKIDRSNSLVTMLVVSHGSI